MTEQIPQTPPVPLTPAEEKQWAMIAHLSVLINLFTGFIGVGVPLLLYFIYKDRSRFVAFHSMQAFIMQAIGSFGGLLLAVVISTIGGVIPGVNLICLPLSCIFWLLPGAALVYGVIGGIQVNNGQAFKYWMIGDWAENILKNQN